MRENVKLVFERMEELGARATRPSALEQRRRWWRKEASRHGALSPARRIAEKAPSPAVPSTAGAEGRD